MILHSGHHDLNVSFPFGTRNKIFDLGIFFKVQSKRFLSSNEFSISFIRDPLSPVFDTLPPFSSKNEDNVFNPGEDIPNLGFRFPFLFRLDHSKYGCICRLSQHDVLSSNKEHIVIIRY
ncbi:hypothetical protein Tco_0588883 [Tanacetum coccineum]